MLWVNDLLYQLYLASSKYGVGLGTPVSSLKWCHVNLVVTAMLGLGVVISARFFGRCSNRLDVLFFGISLGRKSARRVFF